MLRSLAAVYSLLYRYGFEYAWKADTTGGGVQFINTFRQITFFVQKKIVANFRYLSHCLMIEKGMHQIKVLSVLSTTKCIRHYR